MAKKAASTVPRQVVELVRRFDEHRDSYRGERYNETQLRQDFLDPFFAALGWDVYNREGCAEAYRDVILEQSLRVEQSVRAPDYCFRIGGTAKFFVEAKKPAVDIKSDLGPAFQLRRYAWTAKLLLSILTDFEELAVYDCRVKPDKADKASTARVMLVGYQEYAGRWDEIADVFSRDAIRRGSFDKYAESTKKKRGTAEVDEAFLAEIEAWRESLAKNLSLRNDNLSDRQLNTAVQLIIDRVIFLRMCEGRGIEPYGRLQSLMNGPNAYARLVEMFHRADEKYNSGLFHFEKERGREDPDTLTTGLAIDDKVLKEIIRRLHYPESPYEFAALPADILGQVYEQFLGKVIRLTAGHRAKVEEKPEVRKAGGVYYTPTYIVNYIVQNTVGKLLPSPSGRGAGGEGGAGKQKRFRPPTLRILDPACGSGSFLIVAYQYLLDWYLKQYTEVDKPAKHARGANPRVYQTGTDDWRLTTAERKRILLAHIYGVDIDYQACEVTKLSLLLKVLEGETEATLQRQLFAKDRALPDLANNIKCGNSLIGPDFYEGRQRDLFDEDQMLRINAFDWKREFPQVFPLAPGESPGAGRDKRKAAPGESPGAKYAGGFDAVIGNPPYVNAWELYSNDPGVRDYINRSTLYKTAKRHWDLYILFIERALQLTVHRGRVSFIIPFSYAIQKYARESRNALLTKASLESVADLRAIRVFGEVPVITIIPVISNEPPDVQSRTEILRPGSDATKRHAGTISLSHNILQRRFLDQHEEMLRLDLSEAGLQLCQRIEKNSLRMADLCWVNYGAQMSSREKGKFGKGHVLRDCPETPTCRKTVAGRDLYRYRVTWNGAYVEWALSHEMYGARHAAFFEMPKLMLRDITGTHRLELTFDESGLYCDHTILCAQRACDALSWHEMDAAMVEQSRMYSYELLQGLLASRLVSAYYYLTLTGEGVRTGGGFHTYPATIRKLPVYRLADVSGAAVTNVGHIEKLARRMLDLNKRLREVKTDHDRNILQRRIDATDREIDQLVYQLYGLTDKEIALVEEATG